MMTGVRPFGREAGGRRGEHRENRGEREYISISKFILGGCRYGTVFCWLVKERVFLYVNYIELLGATTSPGLLGERNAKGEQYHLYTLNSQSKEQSKWRNRVIFLLRRLGPKIRVSPLWRYRSQVKSKCEIVLQCYVAPLN